MLKFPGHWPMITLPWLVKKLGKDKSFESTIKHSIKCQYFSTRITHYEQRLRTLHYKKKFPIWLTEIKPKILAVLEASKEVQRSKRLRRMLELILAFGNYMNRGQRGNAVGFKLLSLTRIADTKSSCNKSTTLLHFIADTCDKKVQVDGCSFSCQKFYA